jgi:hypothetical protein
MFQFLRGIVLVVVVMLGCEAALARTANEVVPGCRDAIAGKDMNWLACLGASEALWKEAVGICVPIDVTTEQVIQVSIKYIDDRPARMHESFNALAVEALRAAWPCKK